MIPRPLTPQERAEIEKRYIGREATQWSNRVCADATCLLAAEAYQRERTERLAGVLRILFYRHPGNPLLFYRHPGNPPLTKAEYDTIRTVLAEEPKA